MPTWHKMIHKFSHELHDTSKIRTLQHSINMKHNWLEPNYTNVVIKMYMNCGIANCSSYGHNIEHNR